MFNFVASGIKNAFDKINDISNKVQKLSEFVKDPLTNYILFKVKDNFDKEQSPDGVKWLPSIRTRLVGGKILYQSGKLKNSIYVKVNGQSIQIGSDLHYAKTHQFGATIRPKYKPLLKFKLANGKWISKKQVIIPQRRFLGIPKDADMLNFILDNFEKQHQINIKV